MSFQYVGSLNRAVQFGNPDIVWDTYRVFKLVPAKTE